MWFSGQHKTGLLSRLSHLIIFQGIFVFAAVALVLFYPSHDVTTGAETTQLRQLVRGTGDRIVSQVTSARGETNGVDGKVSESLRLEHEIDGACLLKLKQGNFRAVYQLGVQIPGLDSSQLRSSESSSSFDEQLARVIGDEHPGFMLSNIISATKSLYYYHPVSRSSDTLVFVALVNHNLLISARDEIRYMLLVLFLVSTLVSLLVAYLLAKKVRQPLAQVARAIEKSAQGDVYCQTSTEGDEDLVALTNSANRLTEALLTSREQVSHVNESLAQTRQFLFAVLDSSPLSIVVTEPGGTILSVNKEAATVFCVEGGGVRGKQIKELLNVPSGEAGDLSIATHEFEAVGRRGDGESFPVYMITSPLQDSTGGIWAKLYIVRDISESKSFQEMMIRLDRYSTRGEMAGEIAHEINNYLAVLSGNVELMPILLRKGDQEKISKKLELMKSTVDRIAKFTDGLMDGGDEELRLEPCNLNQIIENVLAFLKPQNKFDALDLQASLGTDLPIIYADSGQIQQLLVNMVNNAADASTGLPTKGRIVIRTLSQPGAGGEAVRIEISDNGAGVAEDKVPLLFVKRFTTKRRGHGIGLITCHKIVEAHGGRLGYEYQNGAHFWIELPVTRNRVTGPAQPAQVESPVVTS